MKYFLEYIRHRYLTNEITSEQALEEIARKLGFEMSFCKCMYKDTEFRERGLYCTECGNLISKFKN